jgi:hypothetical protein
LRGSDSLNDDHRCGVLALFASTAGAFFQGRQMLDLEREKFGFSKMRATQKQQHELILKMISVGMFSRLKPTSNFSPKRG